MITIREAVFGFWSPGSIRVAPILDTDIHTRLVESGSVVGLSSTLVRLFTIAIRTFLSEMRHAYRH